MRRIISILLSVLMIVSMCTVTMVGASAEDVAVVLPDEPTLTKLSDAEMEAKGYTKLTDFANIETNGKYYLGGNITVEATFTDVFSGELNGNGYTITAKAPVFATLSEATISNVTISGDITTAEADNIALLAKMANGTSNKSTIITNVITKGSVTGTSSTDAGYGTAGLVAVATGTVKVEKCYNYATIVGNAYDGGIIGYSAADSNVTISDCVNCGNVTHNFGVQSSDCGAAGICSYAAEDITIKNCDNYGVINSYWRQGAGIIGYTLKGYTIDNCDNYNDVTACVKESYDEDTEKYVGGAYTATMAGGILGYAKAASESTGTISNCSNSGTIKADERAAGIIAHGSTMANFSVTDCTNDGTVICTGVDTSGFSGGICGSVAGGSETSLIKDCTNRGSVYVYMRHNSGEKNSGGIAAHTGGTFDVENCDNFGAVTSEVVSSTYATLIFSGGIIGRTDGASSEVKLEDCDNNAKVTSSNFAAGIVSYVNSVKSITITNCHNKANATIKLKKAGSSTNDKRGAAGFIAYLKATVATIENCSNAADIISDSRQAAGIIGNGQYSGYTINNCVNSGNITATAGSAGGLVANANAASTGYDRKIVGCTNTGTVSASEYVGGIAGYFNTSDNSLIEKCVNSGDVIGPAATAAKAAGGIVGWIKGVKSCVVTKCVNTGKVSGTDNVGGIVGNFQGVSTKGKADALSYGYLTYCYNNGEVTASGNYATGIYGSTTGSGDNYIEPIIKFNGVGYDAKIKNSGEGYACGVGGHTSVFHLTISDNFFLGSLEASADALELAIVNSQVSPLFNEYAPNECKREYYAEEKDFINNYVLADSTYTYAKTGDYYESGENAATNPAGDDKTYSIADVADKYKLDVADVASGKLAALMQTATGESEVVWGQAIGIDPNPVLFGEEVLYREASGEYYNGIVERKLALDESFSYKVTAGAPETAKMVFTLNGVETEATATKVGNVYVYTFDGIAPQFIDTEITSTLYVDGEAVETKTETILDYCEALYADAKTTDAEKKLIEKVYLYGKAARDYVVDAKKLYTAVQLPEVASDVIKAAAGEVAAYTGDMITGNANGASFYSANVYFDSTNSIVLKLKIADGVDHTTVKVNGVAVSTPVEGISTVRFDDIFASAYADADNYVITVGGEAGETLAYSVSIYAQRMATAASTDEMKALAVATYEYGAAATAYVAANAQ